MSATAADPPHPAGENVMTRQAILWPEPDATVDLHDYNAVLLSSSGGKDSQAMIDRVVELTREQHYPLSRLVVVHADLGRVEWEGTRELAERQAAHYGLRFEVVSRIGGTAARASGTYDAGEQYGDLLDYVRRRGMWPSSTTRYCTSDFKRGPIRKVITRLHREWKAAGGVGTFRLLQCMGLRAQESPGRAKRQPLTREDSACTGSREVMTWLPIHRWTEDQVWRRIRASGAPYHPAYDLGMPRLSCVFCIFAPRSALVLAGRHNSELLAEYAEVEAHIGHTFRQDLSLAEIVKAVEAGEDVGAMDGAWNM